MQVASTVSTQAITFQSMKCLFNREHDGSVILLLLSVDTPFLINDDRLFSMFVEVILIGMRSIRFKTYWRTVPTLKTMSAYLHFQAIASSWGGRQGQESRPRGVTKLVG